MEQHIMQGKILWSQWEQWSKVEQRGANKEQCDLSHHCIKKHVICVGGTFYHFRNWEHILFSYLHIFWLLLNTLNLPYFYTFARRQNTHLEAICICSNLPRYKTDIPNPQKYKLIHRFHEPLFPPKLVYTQNLDWEAYNWPRHV